MPLPSSYEVAALVPPLVKTSYTLHLGLARTGAMIAGIRDGGAGQSSDRARRNVVQAEKQCLRLPIALGEEPAAEEELVMAALDSLEAPAIDLRLLADKRIVLVAVAILVYTLGGTFLNLIAAL